MGRRGNMRARPGLLFIIVFAVCLAIVYLSWRSMSPVGVKVKDAYSVQMQNLLDESSKWRHAEGNREGEIRDRDPDYDIENIHQKKVAVAPNLHHEELPNGKEEIVKKQNLKKVTDAKAPEKQTLENDKTEFYRQPNELIAETVKSMERLIHLDFKGAAPQMSYLREFIPMIKKLGATGLLIEYEDMFPYTGMLRYISAKNAYSMDDIQELQNLAKANNLKVMPLIQTFGHLEFVLKSDFNNLRESAYTPQVIDITQNASYSLISEMVKQILTAHPNVTHLHIGCDEVYELGKGATSIQMKSKNISEYQMFLRHVQRVASIVRGYGGREVKAVIWDDELRKISLNDLQVSRLSNLVEIMVWHYTKYVSEAISSEVWDKYAKVFKSVWIASAFKGATGSRQFFTEPLHHIQNHFSWLDVIAAYNQRINFKGVALTGWQRYDHFATLCELLPVAVPSMAVCLATMVNAGFTKEIHIATSRVIRCSGLIEMSFPEIDKKTDRAIVTQDCRFPGHEVYHAIQELYGYTEGMPGIKHRLEGWLSEYQVANHFTSPGQLRVLSRTLAKQSSGFSMVLIPLKRHLSSIYQDDTVNEWVDENILERQRYNNELQKKIQSLEFYKSWPQRPLTYSKYVVNETSGKGSSRLVPDTFQNLNKDIQNKDSNHNTAYIKSVHGLQKQQDLMQGNPQKVVPQAPSFDFKAKTVQTPIKNVSEKQYFGRNQDLSDFSHFKDNNEDLIRKKSSDLIENNNKKNRTANLNYYRVESGRKRYAFPEEKQTIVENIPLNQVDKDERMRREKYVGDEKIDTERGQAQADLKYQNSLDLKDHRDKSGNAFGTYKEGLKSRSEIEKAFAELNKNVANDKLKNNQKPHNGQE